MYLTYSIIEYKLGKGPIAGVITQELIINFIYIADNSEALEANLSGRL